MELSLSQNTGEVRLIASSLLTFYTIYCTALVLYSLAKSHVKSENLLFVSIFFSTCSQVIDRNHDLRDF